MRNIMILLLAALIGCSQAAPPVEPEQEQVNLQPLESRVSEIEANLSKLERQVSQSDNLAKQLAVKHDRLIQELPGMIAQSVVVDEVANDAPQSIEDLSAMFKLLTKGEQEKIDRISRVIHTHSDPLEAISREDMRFALFGNGKHFLAPLLLKVADNSDRFEPDSYKQFMKMTPAETLVFYANYSPIERRQLKQLANRIYDEDNFTDRDIEIIREVPALLRLWSAKQLQEE